MRLFKLTLVVFMFTNCGQDTSSKELPSTSENPSEEISEVKSYNSLYIKSEKDIPECLEENEGQLIYLSYKEVFSHCESLSWVLVDLTGKPGLDGENGAEGLAGVDGIDGLDTLEPATNVWYDAIDNKQWLIGGEGFWNIGVNPWHESVCTGDWRNPTDEEAQSARLHGIFDKSALINGPTKMWLDEIDVDDALCISAISGGSIQAKLTNIGYFCIREVN
ncbi:MAG: hypothetical protein GY861_18840 [bacterium]|nr:hypothetical protein [bacterium]